MNEKNKDSLEKDIRENAAKPKSVEIDGQKVEQHSLWEQIKVDEYLAKKKAMKCKNGGLKIAYM
ncbi:MAG: hypothetical protein LBH08_02745 [Puniceicoccales bacterium]|jgi:hypothetical protein|nr:hypothetical protein [Puniceicoccales bacterium]